MSKRISVYMTPEQKTKELIEKYEIISSANFTSDRNTRNIMAKQCAAICAQHCLETAQWYAEKFGLKYSSDRIEYWQQVLEYLKSEK